MTIFQRAHQTTRNGQGLFFISMLARVLSLECLEDRRFCAIERSSLVCFCFSLLLYLMRVYFCSLPPVSCPSFLRSLSCLFFFSLSVHVLIISGGFHQYFFYLSQYSKPSISVIHALANFHFILILHSHSLALIKTPLPPSIPSR